jgi:succinate dehydrogenase/fumarate reductase cytochrome b subunit
MNHLTDDELVLHYYEEDGPDLVRAERHLETCVDCARAYEGLARTLRAVTPPDVVEAPDDTIAIRRMLLERAGDRESALMARVHAWLTEPRAIALAWLVPVLYPWAAPAIFAGARSGEPLVRGVLVMLALLWACAGPAVAVLVMNGADDRFDRLFSRMRVLGAILATISPSLFMVVARGGRRLDWWYGAIAASAILALVPWPSPSASTPRLRRLHRLSSALLGVFILGHIVNQSLGFVSVPSYAAMRGVMQLASEQSVSYVVIVTMVVMQILTGAAMGLKRLPSGAVARHLQAVSGWSLAVFLFAHVCSPYLQARQLPAAPVAQVLTPPQLLATATSVASLPFYLLGVSAFLLHVGLYARLAALGWFAEASVRRWSYAAAVVGAMVVGTVGLSLCGIHILR